MADESNDNGTTNFGKETVEDRQMVAVPFYGDQIVSFMHAGQPHVAMRRVVENLGLKWARQLQKLRDDSRFACIHMCTRDSAGRRQPMSAMPASKLPLWLATINPNKVPDPIKREKVERYQAECAIALHDYWTKGVAVRADNDGLATVTGFDQAAMKALGGMVKGIMTKMMHETLPALVEKAVNDQIGSQQFAVIRGATAANVLDLAGWRDRKGLKGLSTFVSNRLRRFHAERGVVVRRAELGASGAYIFDQVTCREWLSVGGREVIRLRVEERRGQGRLKLVTGTDAIDRLKAEAEQKLAKADRLEAERRERERDGR